MTEEVNSMDLFAQGNVGMSDSELAYLSAMAEVKEKTLQLTKSENSYELVRNRIELLVMKYQNMLLTMEDDNASVYSVEDDDSEVSDPEKNVLVRRAQKAELQAEVSAREALSAKEQIELIRLEKERELEELQVRLQIFLNVDSLFVSMCLNTCFNYSNGYRKWKPNLCWNGKNLNVVWNLKDNPRY